jgi:hypothetical protein
VSAIGEHPDRAAEGVAAEDHAATEPAGNGPAPSDGGAPASVEARAVDMPAELTAVLSIPSDFEFDEVREEARVALAPAAPPLGPLAAFHGNFRGNGFNTIFRPDNPQTPTPLPVPVGGDNILELNLTRETLSFSPSLGSVPNRGSVQGDVFLNGVPYLQTINDITTGKSIGIHFEPGMWVIVPPTKDPAEGSTLVRMASIPHGTTINAQGTFKTFNGPPTIGKVDITPFVEGSPASKIRFPSQTATAHGTPRIPQDLTSFIAAGTITQAILDDPNKLLRDALAGLHITKTTVISISTAPSAPLFGGGTDNIAFLWGDAAAVTSPHPAGQNAQAAQMTAIFWIETVQHTIIVPPFKLGQPAMKLRPKPTHPGQPVPTFNVRPPIEIKTPRTITVSSTQIQYTQTVLLNFAGLSWPHVSVATLVPASPLPVPPSVWH